MTEGPRVVAIAVGNPSRGDDALGPLLLERIGARFPGVVAVEDFQLQIEHALLLEEADLVLFIDAATGLEGPFEFAEIGSDGVMPPLTHALAPQAVLGVFERITGRVAPTAFLLAVRGNGFGLGEPLSDSARVALDAAWGLVCTLLATPQPASWKVCAERYSRISMGHSG